MLLAAQSMAVGTVLVRYVTKHADPIMATGYHMLLGGLPLLWLSYQQEASTLAERLPLLTSEPLYMQSPACTSCQQWEWHSSLGLGLPRRVGSKLTNRQAMADTTSEVRTRDKCCSIEQV